MTTEQAADDLTRRLKRTELQREPSSIPGRIIVQADGTARPTGPPGRLLTEIPVGVASGWHVHPGEEVGYILTSTVRMEIRDRPAFTLDAGTGFLIPPGTPHNATDLGPGTGMMLSTYVVDPEAPLASFVDG